MFQKFYKIFSLPENQKFQKLKERLFSPKMIVRKIPQAIGISGLAIITASVYSSYYYPWIPGWTWKVGDGLLDPNEDGGRQFGKKIVVDVPMKFELIESKCRTYDAYNTILNLKTSLLNILETELEKLKNSYILESLQNTQIRGIQTTLVQNVEKQLPSELEMVEEVLAEEHYRKVNQKPQPSKTVADKVDEDIIKQEAIVEEANIGHYIEEDEAKTDAEKEDFAVEKMTIEEIENIKKKPNPQVQIEEELIAMANVQKQEPDLENRLRKEFKKSFRRNHTKI